MSALQEVPVAMAREGNGAGILRVFDKRKSVLAAVSTKVFLVIVITASTFIVVGAVGYGSGVPGSEEPLQLRLAVEPAVIRVNLGGNGGHTASVELVNGSGYTLQVQGHLEVLVGPSPSGFEAGWYESPPFTIEVIPEELLLQPWERREVLFLFRPGTLQGGFYGVVGFEASATDHCDFSGGREEPGIAVSPGVLLVVLGEGPFVRRAQIREAKVVGATRNLVTLLVENTGNIHLTLTAEVWALDQSGRALAVWKTSKARTLLPGEKRWFTVGCGELPAGTSWLEPLVSAGRSAFYGEKLQVKGEWQGGNAR